MLSGVLTALITPFKDNNLDMPVFERFVEFQIASGINGLVANGTTAETPTLSDKEQDDLLAATVRIAKGRVPVVAGTGGNDTAYVIERTKLAQQAGAEYALITTPYYNKPTQEGLYQHYKAVHDATELPIILYNIPGRSVVDISVETMKRMADLPRIIGVKDATGDLVRPLRTRLEIGEKFMQWSGEDATTSAFLAQGGHGVISVTSNVAPRLLVDMVEAWKMQNFKKFADLRDKLLPLHLALFCETSPAPVKYAASLLGFGSDAVRLPLVPASTTAREKVEVAMRGLGLVA